ncbi:hypothetical protein JCM1840_006124 [Sporobolomyces johnsonii]
MTASPVLPASAPAATQNSNEEKLPTTAELELQPVAENKDKLAGHELWESMGSPKYVVAPMVDQSELAWRILSRVHGANLCYTPMFHAAHFASQPKYQHEMFDLSPGSIEGVAPYDRPLVVQFCANDKEQWLASAKKVVGRCDAVDLNLGCPQGIARKGHYGAFLMEEWDLIRSLISHLHTHLATPVIAKLRVFPSLAKTLSYASHVYSSGAQLLTIHGRTREAKGQLAGFASWSKIKAVVDLISPKVPVLANGGVPSAEEVQPCLDETGAYAVMSAEGNLYNPMIFSPANAAQGRAYVAALPADMREAILACEQELDLSLPWDRDAAAYAPCTYIAAQYLAIVRTIPGTRTSTSAIKAHLYKLFRPVWAAGRHPEMREKLAKAGARGVLEYREKVQEYQGWVDEFRELIKADLAAGLLPADSNRPLTHAEVETLYSGVIPYSHCQPYLRVTKPESAQEEEQLKQVDNDAKRKREQDEAHVVAETADDDLDSKRTKPSPPSPAPPADSTAPPAASVPSLVPCVNHATDAPSSPSSFPRALEIPPCTNSAASKCANAACKACCAALRASGPAPCEFHESKEARAREANQARAEMKRARKAKGVERAKENERWVRDEKERQRREREAVRAAAAAVKNEGEA